MRRSERDWRWLRRALLLAPATDEVLSVPAVLTPVFDAFGTDPYREVRFETVTGANGVTIAVGSSVPDNQLRLVVAAEAFHNDPVARNIYIGFDSPIGAVVAVTDQVSRAANLRIAVLRRLFLNPGSLLVAQVDAIAAGQAVTLQYQYVPLDLGSYAASP